MGHLCCLQAQLQKQPVACSSCFAVCSMQLQWWQGVREPPWAIARVTYIACISCLLVCLLELKPLPAEGESCHDKQHQGSVFGFVPGIVSHGGWLFQSAELCC